MNRGPGAGEQEGETRVPGVRPCGAAMPGSCFLLSAPGFPLRLWQVEGLCGYPEPVGTIGGYEAGTREGGVGLLREAQSRFRAAGVRRVLAPMDGSTWGDYRCVLPEPLSAAHPRFPGEPGCGPERAGDFPAAGFWECARYVSRIHHDLSRRAVAAESPLRRRLGGIRIRTFDPTRAEDDLRRIHAVSLAAFASAPYFRPIPWEQFRDGLRSGPARDPAWTLLAEDAHDRLVGFGSAYPWNDYGPSLVVKTLAVAPDCAPHGLGALLADELHIRAEVAGLKAVIHALMHADNPSVRLSRRYASDLFRSYALYEWRADE